MSGPLRASPARRGDRRREPGRASAARLAALDILRRVEEEGAYASVLLASEDVSLSEEDRALCYHLVMGALRWQLWLDRVIEHCSGRAVSKLDPAVRRILRMGLYQLRRLTRIPPHAAVNESVHLVRHARVRSADAFVNAVLRRAARETAYDPAAQIADPIEKISVQTSHPAWMIERWVETLGPDGAMSFALANNETPPVAFRITGHAGQGDEVLAELRTAGAQLTPSSITPNAWRITAPASLVRRFTRRGRIYLQDEASQLVAHLLGARAGERIFDACAAPGSKTTQLADRSEGMALVVAGDLHEHRARAVLDTARAAGNPPGIRVLVHDATREIPFPDSTFDRVLVDAPCSGTGTLRRNPEIRWRITPADISELAGRQRLILKHVARTLRPGGRLVYSTCSVEKEENEAVTNLFRADHAEFEPARPRVAERLLTEDGAVRTWPHVDGADGFFIARFTKIP